MMLEVEAILFGFIIWEENAVAAMVSMAVLMNMIELEGADGGCEGADASFVIAGITIMLHEKIGVAIRVEDMGTYIDFYD